MEALAAEFKGRVRVVRVDIDPDETLLEKFEADGVPTYLVFRDGVEIDRLEPFLVDWGTESRLRRRIEAALEGAE